MSVTTGVHEAGQTSRVSPPALRARSSRWRDPRIVIGVALVAVSVLVGGLVVGGSQRSVAVWTMRSSMTMGQSVQPNDLVRREVRFPSSTSADRYLSADADLPGGAVLRRDVGAGELLPRAAVVGAESRPLTEVPLSVGTDAVPATVVSGSVVDVWVTPDRESPESPVPRRDGSKLVFDDVTVVSAPRSGSSLGPTSTRQVIIGLSAADEADLPTALTALGSGTVLITRQR